MTQRGPPGRRLISMRLAPASRPAWRVFSAKRTEADYQAWRDQRDFTSRKYAMRERRERFPSQLPNPLMRCPCGETFDGHKMDAR
jgi:hypothetical protein